MEQFSLFFFRPGLLKDQEVTGGDTRNWVYRLPDESRLMELMISVTRTAVPAGALLFVIIYFFCGIYFVYFDPKYNF